MENAGEAPSREPGNRRMSRFLGLVLETGLGLAYLTACSGDVKPTISPTLTPIAPSPTEKAPTIIPTATEAPGFATETNVPYVEPTLKDMEIVPNSGGSGHDEVLFAGVTEEELTAYENAGYAWIEAAGFGKAAVTLEEVTNRLAGDNFRWQMVFRNYLTQDLLWAQSKQDGTTWNTFPTTIKVDTSGVHPDPDWKAVQLPDSKDAVVIFKDGGKNPVAVRNPVTGLDGKMYYSEWFDTTTGQWVKDSAVQAEIPKVPEYFKGVASTLDEFTLIKKEDEAAIVQDILNSQTLTEPQQGGPGGIFPYVVGSFLGVRIECVMGTNCEAAASVRITDPANGPDRWYVYLKVWNAGDVKPHVVKMYIGTNRDAGSLKGSTQTQLENILPANKKGIKINFFIITKVLDDGRFTNPVLTEMLMHTPEQQPARDELHDTLKIPDTLEDPVWMQQAI